MDDRRVSLSLKPPDNRPFNWLPRQGEVSSIGEWIIQGLIKALACLPVYTAIVVTLVLLVQIFGVPFVGGD